MLYNLEVLRDGSVILTQKIHLPHIRFAWPAINRLAKRFRERGHKIQVKDQAGGIVILTGVAAVHQVSGVMDIPADGEASRAEPSPTPP